MRADWFRTFILVSGMTGLPFFFSQAEENTMGEENMMGETSMMEGEGIMNPVVREDGTRDWAAAQIRAYEEESRLKAGQRKLLARLKENAEFAEEFNQQIEDNLTKLKERPDPVEPVIDQRDHAHKIEQIRMAAEQVDRLIATKLQSEGMTFHPPTSDEQFLRRIYIQAAGRIPTHEEAVSFLEDRSLNKREALIDDLLLRPDYRMQMFNYLSDMMRIGKMHVLQGDSAGYELWVMKQLASNRPWNEIVHDLLSARGSLVTNPEVGWMFRDRGMDLDRLANTMTTFMGAAVGCAQCHDHPLESWTQKEFYELTAFFGGLKIPAYGGKSFGNSRESKTTAAQSIAFVQHREDLALTYPEDWAYDDAEPGAEVDPKFPFYNSLVKSSDFKDPDDHQTVFADWMTHQENTQFAATITNRLWQKAFGSGIIEPVTEMDDIDLASNEDLLRYLAKIMQQINFDMMAFQRVIYNTRAFQAQSGPAPEQGSKYHFPGPIMQRMTAEQAWDSLATLRHGEEVNEHVAPRHLRAQQYDVYQPGALMDLTMENRVTYVPLMAEAAAIRLEYKAEWNQVASRVDSFRRASELPIPAPESHFLRQFGQSTKSVADDGSREGTIPQALTVMNGADLTRNVFANRDAHFYRIAEERDSSGARVDSLYVSFLGRHATAEEKSIISKYDLPIDEIAWILANTREFIFVQ